MSTTSTPRPAYIVQVPHKNGTAGFDIRYISACYSAGATLHVLLNHDHPFLEPFSIALGYDDARTATKWADTLIDHMKAHELAQP